MQQLTNTDKQLFDILGEEIKKELSFGCYVILSETEILQVSWKRKDFYEINIKWEQEYRDVTIMSTWKKTCELHWKFDKEILWHYPNHAEVLRYVYNQDIDAIEINLDLNTIEIDLDYYDNKDKYKGARLILDLSKDIKDYTEEQKNQLILFLKEIG